MCSIVVRLVIYSVALIMTGGSNVSLWSVIGGGDGGGGPEAFALSETQLPAAMNDVARSAARIQKLVAIEKLQILLAVDLIGLTAL